jgi:hypothetical protein
VYISSKKFALLVTRAAVAATDAKDAAAVRKAVDALADGDMEFIAFAAPISAFVAHDKNAAMTWAANAIDPLRPAPAKKK